METIPKTEAPPPNRQPAERLAYSIQEAADLLGVNYFSVYRLIQRRQIKSLPRLARQIARAAN